MFPIGAGASAPVLNRRRPDAASRAQVAAAVSLDWAADAAAALGANLVKPRRTRRLVIALALGAAAGLGAARGAAVWTYYGKPQLAAWAAAGDVAAARAPRNTTVCVGAEWHRYPSTFFLPPNARLAFLKTAFDGQLPRAYDAPQHLGLAGARALASADVARHFNDGGEPRGDRLCRSFERGVQTF